MVVVGERDKGRNIGSWNKGGGKNKLWSRDNCCFDPLDRLVRNCRA